MAAPGKTKKTNASFLKYALKRVWMAEGASEEHGEAVAEALMTGIRQGKLNQGLGVYEAIDIMNQMGLLDIKAVPEIVKEGPTWAVYDGKESTGYWTLTKMTKTAIAKAKEHGIAIVFGFNHNDGGSFGSYTWMAAQEDCVALTSNNSVPMCSPLGGMGNVISVPPLDAIGPYGEKAPVWMSTKLCEWYDADTAQAVLQGTKLKGNFVIDPDTGELSNDLAPYARPIEGYGRVFDQSAFQALGEPRTYMLNLWNELMTAIINPNGVIAPEVPSLTEIAAGEAKSTSVGGSYMLVIDPSHFGPIEEVKRKSDALATAIENTKPLPGSRGCRMPGSEGWKSLLSGAEDCEVLDSHWEPFFKTQAGRHGFTEESLWADWEKENK
ncbi:Ldh family oxidoreductase [Paraferrimonas sp. SM1919]|uniref:Ldh family oxidoreductase n=1 Tax=Paraferrimonas sp. SM1919 TaxID=2662263 RepID=UPI0013D8DF3C|nr:Ldh family oxidoreductase [Paraferrimonas sp. SM1919]